MLATILFYFGCSSEIKIQTEEPVKMEWLYINGNWVHISPTDVYKILDKDGKLLSTGGVVK